MQENLRLVGYPVFIQRWEESEAGFGIRPDGCSLHLSLDDCRDFCEEALQSQFQLLGPKTPHEYSRLSGRASKVLINEDFFNKVKETKNGLRIQPWDMKTVREAILLP